jgi:hypothetical protein
MKVVSLSRKSVGKRKLKYKSNCGLKKIGKLRDEIRGLEKEKKKLLLTICLMIIAGDRENYIRVRYIEDFSSKFKTSFPAIHSQVLRSQVDDLKIKIGSYKNISNTRWFM